MRNLVFSAIILGLFFLSFNPSMEKTGSKTIKPYFDKEEYKELLLISIRTTDLKTYYSRFPKPDNYRLIYQSDEIGLGNLWQLWVDKHLSKAVISIRGTTRKEESVLSNLYAAMVPAKGSLQLSPSDLFEYELAPDSKATVHIGWLISMAYLSRDILPKIDSLYRKDIKDFLLIGHSQGAAINYLLTAYLRNLQKKGKLPSDIRFKTYCSAPPKPGNLYFAYYYEFLTQNGWSYTVVNAADWVPEVPISIQTLEDLNTSNPFTNAKQGIKYLKFPKNIVVKSIYNKLDKPPKKARDNYKKFLGEKSALFIKKYLKDFVPPSEYANSTNYSRAGTTVVLYPDKTYYQSFPKDTTDMLLHHNFEAYLFLLDRLNVE